MQLDLGFSGPISITELTKKIRDTLESGFGDVWVQGEITNLRIPASGHMYMTLKDAKAQIRAVMFRSGGRFLKFRPEDGLEVIARGKVTVYEPRGEYQVIVEYMEPKGLGALQLAFIQLKEKLEKEGLFDEARKQPLPKYPKRVGVVTSETGAAIRDILNVLGRRAPGVEIVIAPASVQGDAAPYEIAQAIRDLNEFGGLDVMIVGRGGGSVEDLAAFNTETVARAVSASGTPIISAVGHETDFTICDFVADLRAPTPSAAAEVVAVSEEELIDEVRGLGNRLRRTVTGELREMRSRLEYETRALGDPHRPLQDMMMRSDELGARLLRGLTANTAMMRSKAVSLAEVLRRLGPMSQVEVGRMRATELSGRLVASAKMSVRDSSDRMRRTAGLLHSLSPLSELARGYTLTRKLPGLATVSEHTGVQAGDRLLLSFRRGGAECVVERTIVGDTPASFGEASGDNVDTGRGA
jgi:exodeoxyribonuclease VII large subunit